MENLEAKRELSRLGGRDPGRKALVGIAREGFTEEIHSSEGVPDTPDRFPKIHLPTVVGNLSKILRLNKSYLAKTGKTDPVIFIFKLGQVSHKKAFLTELPEFFADPSEEAYPEIRIAKRVGIEFPPL
jgi:hypothetical protein